MRLHVVLPKTLSRLGIQTMDEAGKIRDEEQAFGSDRNRGHTSVNFLVAPEDAGVCHITGLGSIDADQVPYSFVMLRVLARSHVHAVFPKHRRPGDFAWPVRSRILDRLAVLHFVFWRIAVGLPDNRQVTAPVFETWFRIECVTKSITASEEDQLPLADFASRGGAPCEV